MQIIDLSKTLENGMEIYPGDPEVEIEQVHFLNTHGWNLRRLSLGSHTGTHTDAPVHMDEGGATLDQLPLDRFMGPARCVAATDEFPSRTGLVFSEGEVSPEVLPKIVVAEPPFVVTGDGAHLHIDVERALLERGIITFTDLINLDQLPLDEDFAFYGIPLKIKDGDGSPIRAFAVVG